VQPFRRHKRFFLIALAVFLAQTFLALAHVHAPSKFPLGVYASDQGQSGSAPGPGDDGLDCPLCGAIHLASTLISSDGPAVSLHILFAGDRPTVVVAVERPTPRASRFYARAPPARVA
jgi:hypothetical protein